MVSTATYKCRCGGEFTARTADRARGWARFCSKRCKAIEQEGRTGQYRAMLDNVSQNDFDQAAADDEAGWDGHKGHSF